MRMQFKMPVMTHLFWVAFIITYLFCMSTIYGIITVPEEMFDVKNALEVLSLIKLLSIRLTFGVVFLSIYPVLLLTSIKWSNYFVVAVTAWCIAMYVDDLMVLNKIIEYPERGLIAIIQSIRPILILSLIWMSFELSIKSSVER